jgi:hypothetical protein
MIKLMSGLPPPTICIAVTAFGALFLTPSNVLAEQPVPVKIHLQAGDPVHTMRGGIGASFHVINRELPGKHGARGSWSGSAWGGNPSPDDDAHWQELFHHAEWLGLDWCRVELEQRVYEPARGQFSWDNGEMRTLYRILDWAERRGVDVFLQQMWGDVAWNAYPGMADDPVRTLRSAPRSIPDWANGIGELVDHLVRAKGYKCIRWVSIVNEPGSDGFSWWQDANLRSLPLAPGLKAVRAELDRRGLNVPLSGPDWSDLANLDPSRIDFDEAIGSYDLHCYVAVFDSMDSGYKLSEAGRRLAKWAEWAHAKGKPFFLSELGTMAFGWGNEDAAPASYESGLKDASLVVRGINAGVDGFNRWSFVNRGDLDGQWQLVRTWDIDRGRLLDRFEPQANAYYQYGMLSRFVPKHSSVLATRVEAPFGAGERTLVAAALRSSKGNLTLIAVNESHREADAVIDLNGLAGPATLYRYAMTRAERDRTDVQIRPGRKLDAAKAFADRIPPLSIVVYSSYRLEASDPGLISE